MIAGMAELPRNDQLAEQFELLGDLMELEGADGFRISAYRKAAARIRETPTSVAQLALDGKAKQLQDIGKTIEAKIVEVVTDGEIHALTKRKVEVPAEVAVEYRERAGQLPHRSVGVPADAAASYHPRPAAHQVDVGRRRLRGGDPVHRLGKRGEAVDTRTTLSRGLGCQVGQDPRSLHDSAAARGQHSEHAAALGRRKGTPRSLKDATHSGSKIDFVDAGIPDVSAQCHQRTPRRELGPHLTEPRAPKPSDHRDVREGLGVLNQGRTLVDAFLGRALKAEPRLGRSARCTVHHR